jgi:hypothetical protein
VIFLLLSPLLDRDPAVGGADELHAERPGQEAAWESDFTVVAMECGATVAIAEDGTTTPDGFDFYHPDWADKATCAACRKALGL